VVALCLFCSDRCGLFLHSPFPSSEIFRTFPKREELLRSMLNADLIGEGRPWLVMLLLKAELVKFTPPCTAPEALLL
jgi:hypothetical protein